MLYKSKGNHLVLDDLLSPCLPASTKSRGGGQRRHMIRSMIEFLVYPRERICILDGCIIQLSIVDAKPGGTIFLFREHYA